MNRTQLFREILSWIFTAKENDRPERVAEVLKRISDLDLLALATSTRNTKDASKGGQF